MTGETRENIRVVQLKLLEMKLESVGDGDNNSEKCIVQINKDIGHDE